MFRFQNLFFNNKSSFSLFTTLVRSESNNSLAISPDQHCSDVTVRLAAAAAGKCSCSTVALRLRCVARRERWRSSPRADWEQSCITSRDSSIFMRNPPSHDIFCYECFSDICCLEAAACAGAGAGQGGSRLLPVRSRQPVGLHRPLPLHLQPAALLQLEGVGGQQGGGGSAAAQCSNECS